MQTVKNTVIYHWRELAEHMQANAKNATERRKIARAIQYATLIAERTEHNDHCLALELAALALGSACPHKLLAGVRAMTAVRDYDCGMPQGIATYRDTVLRPRVEAIGRRTLGDAWQIIHLSM